MTNLRGHLGLMLIGLVWLSPMAVAQDYQAGAIKIVQPWMRQTPAAAKVAGGYMTLVNTGTTPDRLIGGTLVDAARFEVHEMSVTDGIMRMRALHAGLEIKPGETVVLKPGSYHVMFMELKAAPQAGKRLKGTLVFEKAGTIEVEYKVEAASASTPGGAGSHGRGSGSGAMKNGNQ